MLMSGTPFGATSTVGRRLPGTLGAPTIWALAVPTAIAASTVRMNALPPEVEVALLAPLPVLVAVS